MTLRIGPAGGNLAFPVGFKLSVLFGNAASPDSPPQPVNQRVTELRALRAKPGEPYLGICRLFHYNGLQWEKERWLP